MEIKSLTAVPKRRATDVADGPVESETQRPEVNALSSGLLRKKLKGKLV